MANTAEGEVMADEKMVSIERAVVRAQESITAKQKAVIAALRRDADALRGNPKARPRLRQLERLLEQAEAEFLFAQRERNDASRGARLAAR